MRHHCWGGHLFAGSVGVLPTVPDALVLDPRLVLSVPVRDLGRRSSKRRRRLRRELLRCDCDVTRDVAPTVDARTSRR